MTRICPGLILCFFLLTVPVQTQDAPQKVFNAQTATLANGLQLIVITSHRTPAVTHMIWYRAGAADEPWGTSGLAHFLEHLNFKGTPDVPSGQFSARVQQMGGDDNAFTSWDYTAFHETVPKEHLADVMRMDAERMNNLTPKVDEIFSEKLVVIEERRQTTDNDPGAVLAERMRNALFVNHPYGRPILGWMKEMQTLTWVDSLAFYRNHYAPNNAIVVLSGDVTMAEARPLAERYYGPLKYEDVPERHRPQAVDLAGSTTITLSAPDVRQPVWERLYRAPSAHENAKASLALSILEDLLNGATGHLYQELAVKRKIVSAIDASYQPYAWDDAMFELSATPMQGVAPQQVQQAVDAVLQNLARTGFTQDELNVSVSRMQDAAVYARDSLVGPAMTVGYGVASGAGLDYVETWPQALKAVTPAEVTDALRTWIANEKGSRAGVDGFLLPQAEAPKASPGQKR